MLYYYYRYINNAIAASEDDSFVDEGAETTIEVGPSGSEHEVTYYSDGSCTVNFGGVGGKVNYNQKGEEC